MIWGTKPISQNFVKFLLRFGFRSAGLAAGTAAAPLIFLLRFGFRSTGLAADTAVAPLIFL